MDRPPFPRQPTPAESLFAAWIATRSDDIETLVREHAQHARELRMLHAHWLGVETLLRILDRGAGASFSARLEATHGDRVDPRVSLDAPPSAASTGATGNLVRRLSQHPLEKSRYEVEGEVARGGMGAILRVWDGDLRRHLAMKVILGRGDATGSDGARSADANQLARFLEEAQVTSQLDHPGIVPVHELGLDADGRLYFTMKLVKGRDLEAIFALSFEEQDGWNETRVLSVILKACEALAYAHAKGVVHRDLKPANIMVGGFGEVFVMDWGLARVLSRKDSHDLRIAPELETSMPPVRTERREEREGSPDSPIMTMDGDVVGTPAYMPLEQARGDIEALSARSDVYAVGAMLYHLLARQPPYMAPGTRASSYTVLTMVLQGPPAALGSLRQDIPAELVAICEKAMARDAAQRYPDTLALAEDLRAFLEHRVVGAYETGAVAELRKWVVRNKPLAAALAAAVLVLIGGVVTSTTFAARATAGEGRAKAETARAEREALAVGIAREEAEQSAGFMSDLLESAGPLVKGGRDVTLLREMTDDVVARIDRGELAGAPTAELRLRGTAGEVYRQIGEYERAGRVLGPALELARSLHSGDHADVAEALTKTGDLLAALGDAAGAERHFREALDMRRRLHAGDHRDLAVCINDLGVILQDKGELAAAELLLREALEMRQRLFPGDAPDVAESLSGLGILLGMQAGEPLARAALEMWTRLYPGDHPRVALGHNNLALFLQGSGDLAGAERHYVESLDMARRLFPGDHAQVVRGLLNLAVVRQSRSQLPSAEELLREGIEMCGRLYEGDHSILGSCFNTLGTVRRDQGDLDDAERHFRRAVDIGQRIYPGGHASTATAMQNVARMHVARGDLATAEPLFREALDMRRRLAPEGYPELASNLAELAGFYKHTSRLDLAEPLFREMLAVLERSSPPGDLNLAINRVGVGGGLSMLGKFADAEPMLVEGFRTLRASPHTPRSPDDYLVGACERIIKHYEAWDAAERAAGRAGKAAELAQWRAELAALPPPTAK